MPDPGVFSESETGKALMELLKDKTLGGIMKVYVSRKTVRVDTGEGIFEIALDNGKIVAGGGTCPVCEMEIELYSGNQEEMLKLGEKLQQKYDLEPEKRSKYARGLALLGKI